MLGGTARRSFMKNWFAVEAVPIYFVVAFAVGGAGWYTARLATRPDIIWNRKSNPEPWQSVKPDETTKLMDGGHKFEKSWSRDKV